MCADGAAYMCTPLDALFVLLYIIDDCKVWLHRDLLLHCRAPCIKRDGNLHVSRCQLLHTSINQS